jgi:hypothetical protein
MAEPRVNTGLVQDWGRSEVVPPSPIGTTTLWLAAPTTTAAGLIQENGITNGSLVYLPAGTINEIGIRVTVVGSAGALIRLGVYAFSGLTGTLLWDAGTIDGTSATTQSISGGAIPIKRGWYVLTATLQGAPATRPTINRNTGIAPYTFISQTGASALENQIAFPAGTGVQENSITGALPATATFYVDGSRSQIPARVAVKGTWI